MYFPLITMRSSSMRKRDLSPRAGGGGGGRGGGGGGGGKSGGSSGSSGGSSGAGRSSPISSGGTSRSATPFGSGGGPVTTIPSGQMFAGRTAGGGTRNQVYGTSQYGSGYPNQAGRGVAGRGFPFVFWPLAWGGAAGAGGAGYLHNREYGNPDNSSRPGGPMVTATFASSTSNTTFHLVADKQTVVDLIQDIRDGCSSKSLATDKSSTSPSPYNDTDPSSPKPESTIQYYRASSVALTLDGYNNSAALAETEGQPDTPLPSNIDTTLKDCLNQTIGAAVPLIGGAEMRWAAPNVGILALVWVFLHLTTAI